MSRTDMNVDSKGFPIYQTKRYQIETRPGNQITGPKDDTTRSLIQTGNVRHFQRAGTTSPHPPYTKPNGFHAQGWTWKPATGVRVREKIFYPSIPNWTYLERETLSGCIDAIQRTNGANAYPPSLAVTNLVNTANQQALNRVKNQDANLAEDWAERHKSLEMIATSAKNLAESYRALRRGNLVQAANVLGLGRPLGHGKNGAPLRGKKLSDAWLEYRYGWMPIILDAHGAVSALHRSFTSDRTKLCKATGHAELKWFNRSQTKPDGLTTLTTELTSEVEVHTVLYYRRSNNTLATLDSLGLINPIALGWELLPFSFVVDWFIGIGDFLNNLTTGFGYEFDSGCTTVFKSGTETKTTTWKGVDVSGYTWKGGTTESAESFTCDRDLLAFLPVFTLPAFRGNTSFKRATDGIALLSQHRGK